MSDPIDYQTLQAKGQLCDAEVHIGESVYNVHKVLFVPRYKYFEKLFLGEVTSGQKVYRITEPWLTPEVFEYIMDRVYNRKTHREKFPKLKDMALAAKNLESTRRAADDLLLYECKRLSEEHNLFRICTSADLDLSDTYLRNGIGRILADEPEFFKTHSDIMNIKPATMKIVMSRSCPYPRTLESLHAFSKTNYETLMAWVNYQANKRKTHVAELFEAFQHQLHGLDSEFIRDEVLTGPLVLESPGALKVIADYLAEKVVSLEAEVERLRDSVNSRDPYGYMYDRSNQSGREYKKQIDEEVDKWFTNFENEYKANWFYDMV